MAVFNGDERTLRDERNAEALKHEGHAVQEIGKSVNTSTPVPGVRIETRKFMCCQCGVVFTVYNWLIDHERRSRVPETKHIE